MHGKGGKKNPVRQKNPVAKNPGFDCIRFRQFDFSYRLDSRGHKRRKFYLWPFGPPGTIAQGQ